MNEMNEMPACERASDLVGFLYGDASEAEANAFRQHMQRCDSCADEVKAFGQVRQSICDWRQQALSPMTFAEPTSARAQNIASANGNVARERKPSALAAIREFFTIAPMWMRGATAFATLLLVALSVVAVMHFMERGSTTIVKQVETPVVPPAQPVAPTVTAQVSPNESPLSPAPINSSADKTNETTATATKQAVRRNNYPASKELARANRKSSSLSATERRQLARDLQLVAANEDEENVPRLSDLLNESY